MMVGGDWLTSVPCPGVLEQETSDTRTIAALQKRCRAQGQR